jgi:hypothetical protein
MSLGPAGIDDTAVGRSVMAFSTGTNNVAVGYTAMNLATGSNNVGIGHFALDNVSGDTNIAIGELAGQSLTSGSNNIEIGSEGAKNDNAIIRIGASRTRTKTFIAGINVATIFGGAAVMINSKGQLGVATSSARYKDEIQPMAKPSEAILSLQPVTFRYKRLFRSSA